MKRFSAFTAVAAVALVWAFFYEALHAGGNPGPALIGLDGRLLPEGDYRGRATVLYFFSPEDAAQRRAALALQEVWGRYRHAGVAVIGVGCGASPTALREFARGQRLSYPLAVGTQEVKRDYAARAALPWEAVEARDMTVLLDQDAGVAYAQPGYDPPAVAMELTRLLIPTEVDESTWGKIKELFR